MCLLGKKSVFCVFGKRQDRKDTEREREREREVRVESEGERELERERGEEGERDIGILFGSAIFSIN